MFIINIYYNFLGLIISVVKWPSEIIHRSVHVDIDIDHNACHFRSFRSVGLSLGSGDPQGSMKHIQGANDGTLILCMVHFTYTTKCGKTMTALSVKFTV